MPRVSVILTSFNHARFLRESIDSVLAQSFGDFELVIVDDDSEDESWDIIRGYADPRIRAVRNERRLGPAVGVNRAIREARGEFIAIHHSDDAWEPGKLAGQVAFLDANPGVGAVFTRARLVDDDGQPFRGEDHFYSRVFDQPNRTRHEWLRFFFTQGNALCHPSVLIRRACYETCGGYDAGLAQLPDFDMWIRLCLAYEIHVMPERLVRFRIRGGEANTSGIRPDTRIRSQFEFHRVLGNFRRVASADELARIFPAARRHDRGAETDLAFALAMAALKESDFPITQLFALDLLFEALADPVRCAAIGRAYAFGHLDLIKLTAAHDVFSREQLAVLNGTVAGHEARIATLQGELAAAAALAAELGASRSQLEERARLHEQQVQQASSALAALSEAQLEFGRRAALDAEQLRTQGEALELRGRLLDAANAELATVRAKLQQREEQLQATQSEAARFQERLHARELQFEQARTELATAGARLEDREVQLRHARSELAALQGRLALSAQQIAAANGELASAHAQLAAARDALAAQSAQATTLRASLSATQQQLSIVSEQLAATLQSRSWRAMGPARTAGRALRRLARGAARLTGLRAPAEVAAADTRLLYSIDSLRLSGERVYGWGWMLHPDEQIAGIALRARRSGTIRDLDVQYGIPRPDVARDFDAVPNADRAGFLVSGWLPRHFREMQLSLRVEFAGGRVAEAPLAVLDDRIAAAAPGATTGARSLRAAVLRRLPPSSAALLRRARAWMRSGLYSSRDLLEATRGRHRAFLSALGDPAVIQRKLIVDHNLGGGSNLYREHWLQDARARGASPVVLYYDLPSLRFCLCCDSPQGAIEVHLRRLEDVGQLLAGTRFEEVFLSNAVSFQEPLPLVAWLADFAKASGARFTVALHDYFAICPSWTLLDEQMRFCGVPDRSRCASCLPRHQGEFTRLMDMRGTEIGGWRESWGRALGHADGILAFSGASAELLRRAYPSLDERRIEIRPHKVEHLPRSRIDANRDGPLNIGVVGTIAPHKGAHVVRELAEYIDAHACPVSITVVGRIDDEQGTDWARFRCLKVTGPFAHSELPALLEAHSVNMCLLPSIWPETFSYVAEEIMQLGLPLAVFDLGAPAERASRYARGLILRDREPARIMLSLQAFHEQLGDDAQPLVGAEGGAGQAKEERTIHE